MTGFNNTTIYNKRNCPHCSEKISEESNYCPKCHLNLKKYDIERFIMLIILSLLALIAIFFKFIK